MENRTVEDVRQRGEEYSLIRVPQTLWHQCSRFDAYIFGRDAWAETVWQNELANPQRCFFMMRSAPAPHQSVGQIRALGGISLYEDAEILTIGVAPCARRRGYGSRLVSALLAEAKDAGSRCVFLEVRAHDEGAQALYRSFGFRDLAVRKRYYSDDDALTMALNLD